ncbi:ANKRD28 [Branchiostoma lanceolatum]|uniref:ANKRD28 protein n=2 Tax=Branchiostoma lanceolatum TaxID=7740 RepID=A0A8K0A0U3_BRALA|nr:ANKRD28 [Branchiostoma lanceolatum]
MENEEVDKDSRPVKEYFVGAVRTGNGVVLEELLSNGMSALDMGEIDGMCCEEHMTIAGHSEALEVVLKHSPVKTWISEYHQILKKHNSREYLIWQKKNSCCPEMTTMNHELANRRAAMFAAIRYNQPACLDLILTHGVDFRARDFFLNKGVWRQPMATVHLAAALGMSDCIDVLMRHETRAYADKSNRVSRKRFHRKTRDMDGKSCWKTPMIFAAENGHHETISRLKKHNISIDGTNKYNHLSSCIRFGAVDTIFVLCQHGATCYSKPTDQFTPEGPLHHAIKTGNIRIVDVMLRTLGTVDFRPMITDQTDAQVAELLRKMSSAPRTLSHLCRHVIRGMLGEKRCYFGVELLPLPNRLKSFVRLVESSIVGGERSAFWEAPSGGAGQGSPGMDATFEFLHALAHSIW